MCATVERSQEERERRVSSLASYMVRTPRGPRGFPINVIDNLTYLGREHETSAGAEHPPLSARPSRGAFTVFSHKEIDVHLFPAFHSHFILSSVTACLDQLASFAPFFLCALPHLGPNSFFCCHKHFRWPPIP